MSHRLMKVSSDEENVEIPEGSLFDSAIPGVMTTDEVKCLDLDHWRLVVRNSLIELEVPDLVLRTVLVYLMISLIAF